MLIAPELTPPECVVDGLVQSEEDYGFDDPPPRPTTPPVRRGFLVVLSVLCLAALVVYGVLYVTERISYAWESGRARADSEALAKLDKEGIVNRASVLFRMATNAVSPAVVNVQSLRRRRGGDGFAGMPVGGNRLTPGIQGAELGSGVIIDKEHGYIVTNNHVVRDADEIMVRLGPGDDVPARLVGADPKSDLAVLKVKADLKVQAEWGDSEKLEIGDWVLAIGSPLGFDHSVTAGIVSASERSRRDVGIRVIHPDRRGDQSGKLGRAADRSGRAGRRHQYGDHHPVGWLRGNRAGDPFGDGAAGGRKPDQGRQGRARLSGGQDSNRSTWHTRREAPASAVIEAPWSPRCSQAARPSVPG